MSDPFTHLAPPGTPETTGPALPPPGASRVQSARTAFAATDLGNAERLVARHGPDILYCADRRAWLVCDGARWQPDRRGEVQARAIDTVRAIPGGHDGQSPSNAHPARKPEGPRPLGDERAAGGRSMSSPSASKLSRFRPLPPAQQTFDVTQALVCGTGNARHVRTALVAHTAHGDPRRTGPAVSPMAPRTGLGG
jgi:hypothetical protein